MTEVIPTQITPGTTISKIETQTATNQNPMESSSNVKENSTRGSANMYGAFSLETFCNAGSLSYTHEDAQGWLSYVKQFTPPNFWYKDSHVRVWAYNEQYDNWQNTYGMDAVCAAYHSGHGGMDSNGVFYAPMGADWEGLGCTANSKDMFLGNEQARYIFWSTCFSLRVLDGHSPIKTWGHSPDPGWRMIFGFETVSYDNPNYGKFFWEEWNKGKSFSTAWLDASWRISHDQAPSVVACGATKEEAQNRLFQERLFYQSKVSHNWYWWRWYNQASKAVRNLHLSLPQNLLTARLQPVSVGKQFAQALADRFQIDMRIPDEVATTPDSRRFLVVDQDKRIAYSNDGSLDLKLAQPNLSNRKQLPRERATALAQEAVRRYKLDQEVPLVLDRVLTTLEAGGTAQGSGQLEAPSITGTIVEFRQVINGLPVITPGAGTVRISIDNDGTVTHVHSSVRGIEQLSDRPINTSGAPTIVRPNAPAVVSPASSLRSPEPTNYEEKLSAEFNRQVSSWVVKGGRNTPLEFATVPDSTEIGYEIRGNDAILVARKAIEVNFGSGYRKRYWVTTSLFE